jgi:hypothetical protein
VDGEEFTARRAGINAATEAAVLELWDGQTSWRDLDSAEFVEQAVPVVQAGQGTVGALTSVYVADTVTAQFGEYVDPPAVDEDTIQNGRGVPAGEVYRRPYVELYTALAGGRPLSTALELARARLSEIADLDLQRAYSLAARQAMEGLPDEFRPQYWRRVTRGASCALCIVASTERYSRGNLNPIHRRCDCRVEPDYSGATGRALDDARLGRVHAAVAELLGRSDPGARAPDYRSISVAELIGEHGELGPMLVRPRDHFTRL